ncbi:MAG: hypothetical protein KGM98_02230, partial [Bacteroidota bacterium]|nr:hypothetical protein [Bacteroidota bacterium]
QVIDRVRFGIGVFHLYSPRLALLNFPKNPIRYDFDDRGSQKVGSETIFAKINITIRIVSEPLTNI